MEQINDFFNCDNLSLNYINVDPNKSKMVNSSVTFQGKGNILFIEEGVILQNSTIVFNKNNSVVYLSKNRHKYFLHCSVNNGNTCYIGRDCYFNGTINLIASEGMNIIVGNDGLFSFGIWIRTADPHLIYSVETKKRINDSKSVWLGDHIWVGQQCLILKGTQIGSGSIIGGGTVISNKRIPSNTAVAGNPAKVINDGVFFSDECVHGWTEEETAKAEKMTTDKWIYSDSNERKDFAAIDLILRKQCDAAARLEKIEEMLVRDMSKNRFYVGN